MHLSIALETVGIFQFVSTLLAGEAVLVVPALVGGHLFCLKHLENMLTALTKQKKLRNEILFYLAVASWTRGGISWLRWDDADGLGYIGAAALLLQVGSKFS